MKKIGILFALLIATGSLWAQTSINLAPRAEITTTVTGFYGSRDSADHISVLTDGVTISDASDSIADLSNTDGKHLTFALV